MKWEIKLTILLTLVLSAILVLMPTNAHAIDYIPLNYYSVLHTKNGTLNYKSCQANIGDCYVTFEATGVTNIGLAYSINNASSSPVPPILVTNQYYKILLPTPNFPTTLLNGNFTSTFVIGGSTYQLNLKQYAYSDGYIALTFMSPGTGTIGSFNIFFDVIPGSTGNYTLWASNSLFIVPISEADFNVSGMIGQQEKTNEKLDDLNETSKGIWQTIVELPGKLVNLLLDGLKSLIVPSEEDLEALINDIEEPLTELGFVGEILDYSLKLVKMPLTLTSSGDWPRFELGEWCFNVPTHGEACISDGDVVIDMNDYKTNPVINTAVTALKLYTSILIVLFFVRRWNFESPLDLIKGVGKQ